MRALAIVLAAGFWIASSSATAEIYRYTDSNGTEQFTMDINQVPEEHRGQALERVKDAAKRINIVGPKANAPSARGRVHSPARRAGPTTPSGLSEHSWRSRFAAKRRAVEAAEREVENAEAADRTSRGGRSSSARGSQIRWSRNERREDRADARIERAEGRLRAAEDAMHELRQQAAARGVPAEWMR